MSALGGGFVVRAEVGKICDLPFVCLSAKEYKANIKNRYETNMI